MTAGSSPARHRSTWPRGASVNTSAPSTQSGPSANWKFVATRSTMPSSSSRRRSAGVVGAPSGGGGTCVASTARTSRVERSTV